MRGRKPKIYNCHHSTRRHSRGVQQKKIRLMGPLGAMIDMDAILLQMSCNNSSSRQKTKKRCRVEDGNKSVREKDNCKVQQTTKKSRLKEILPIDNPPRAELDKVAGSGNGGFYFATPASNNAQKMLQKQQKQHLVWSRSWPNMYQLGGHLATHEGRPACRSYFVPSGQEYGTACANCGASGALHELKLVNGLKGKISKYSSGVDTSTLAAAFAAVRNVRCAAGEVGEVGNNEPKCERHNLKVMAQAAMVAAKKVVLLIQELARSGALSVGDEIEICTQKSEKLLDAVTAWQCNAGSVTSHNAVLELRMKVIMAADAFFFRLFYVQQGVAPGRIDALAPVPTPPTYFCLVGLASDGGGCIKLGCAGKSALSSFHSTASEDARSILDTELGTHEGTCTWSLKHGGGSHHVEEDNPLLAIFRARRVETIRLLWTTGWATRNAKKCLAAVPRMDMLNGEFDCHQTVAADLLVQWRDSVRDMPASIFAYACPTEAALAEIVKLERPVVEIGAGTGYWAEMLRRRSVHVSAYDKIPPGLDGGFNEYHGLCQPYGVVLQGGTEMVQKHVTAGEKIAALFLCYPPPGLPMAYECLVEYTRSGGDRVIHVGEWQGLTGDMQFEAYLLKEYGMESSVPLPRWGTDAANLTVWYRRKAGDPANAQTCLPICSASGCGKMARKRCRLARDLCYCGDVCFAAHKIQRYARLSTQMIHLDHRGDGGSTLELDCDFENQDQFALLDCLRPIESGQTHGKNRRKNQKNKKKVKNQKNKK